MQYPRSADPLNGKIKYACEKVGFYKKIVERAFSLTPKDTKTGEARRLYFNAEVKGILERLWKVRSISHNFVFTFRGKPLKSIKVCFARALKKANITNFRLHDLRHTFTTNARKAGVDKTVIMKLTGRKTLSMFTRYNSVDEADARKAIQRMEGYLGSAALGTTANPLQVQKRVRGSLLTP